MYRLFGMDDEGRLYQLGYGGWVRTNGSTMPNAQRWRDFLRNVMVPILPNLADAYIAQVDIMGGIIRTETIMEVAA